MATVGAGGHDNGQRHGQADTITEVGDISGNQANQSNSSTGNLIIDEDARELERAALTGNWNAAKDKRDHFDRPITMRNETALHLAIMLGNIVFVKKLLAGMTYDGLKVENEKKETALCMAAINGNMGIAKAILERESEQPISGTGTTLASHRNGNGLLPIHQAAFWRHNSMVRYLYGHSRAHLQEEDYPYLLVCLIKADMFDLVSDIVEVGKELRAITEDRTGETAFHAMAKKPKMFSKVCSWRTHFSKGSRDLRNRSAHHLVKRIWDKMTKDIPEIPTLFEENWRTIFTAVERGNVEFLRLLIRDSPSLVTKNNNQKGWTIFHAAIFHRQEKIFALIHEIGSLSKLVAECIDNEGNNMLHLAAQLAPESRLGIVPGAALQLQLELLWFQEVKDLVGPQFAEAKTLQMNDAKTPRELFIRSHEDLIKRGEEWMRNTANSCIIAAILVASVAFAAAFTLPGGIDQNTGFPIFLYTVPFKIFAVANGVSFVSSVFSVLGFLSILSSSYALKEFSLSLPRKLLIGLSTLLVSIIAMMSAFVTAFFMYFKQSSPLRFDYAVPLAALALFPIFFFLGLYYRIFYSLIKSTCMLKCSPLFSPDHRDPLFSGNQIGLCK